MNDSPISLKDALELMDTLPLQEAMQDERIQEFVKRVESFGTDILTPLDEDYILGAIALIKAMSLGTLIQMALNDENTTDSMNLLTLSQVPILDSIITLVFKFSIGLSAYEEIR